MIVIFRETVFPGRGAFFQKNSVLFCRWKAIF